MDFTDDPKPSKREQQSDEHRDRHLVLNWALKFFLVASFLGGLGFVAGNQGTFGTDGKYLLMVAPFLVAAGGLLQLVGRIMCLAVGNFARVRNWMVWSIVLDLLSGASVVALLFLVDLTVAAKPGVPPNGELYKLIAISVCVFSFAVASFWCFLEGIRDLVYNTGNWALEGRMRKVSGLWMTWVFLIVVVTVLIWFGSLPQGSPEGLGVAILIGTGMQLLVGVLAWIFYVLLLVALMKEY